MPSSGSPGNILEQKMNNPPAIPPPPPPANPPGIPPVIPPGAPLPQAKKKPKGCLTCLILLGGGVLLIALVIFLTPVVLRAFGISSRSAEYLYQQAPDMVASQSLSEVLEEHNIPGVSVYVMPIKGENTKGAFVILDASKGYLGLSPAGSSDEVFMGVLRDLTERNRTENLRIAHLTAEYRDEQGNKMLSFTVNQDDVEKYSDGVISNDEFYGAVHFNLLDTLRDMGLEEVLEEVLP